METNNNIPEQFIFTQGWFDFWFIFIFFAGFMLLAIPSFSLTSLGILVYVLIQIFLPIFIFFRYYAIRYFELNKDFIHIKFGNDNKEIKITKDNLLLVEVKFISGFFLFNRSKDPKIVYNFIYKPTVQLNLKGIANWLYGKKISVNNYLMFDKLDRALDVIYYLEKYYSDILKLDSDAKSYLIEKQKRLKEEIDKS